MSFPILEKCGTMGKPICFRSRWLEAKLRLASDRILSLMNCFIERYSSVEAMVLLISLLHLMCIPKSMLLLFWQQCVIVAVMTL